MFDDVRLLIKMAIKCWVSMNLWSNAFTYSKYEEIKFLSKRPTKQFEQLFTIAIKCHLIEFAEIGCGLEDLLLFRRIFCDNMERKNPSLVLWALHILVFWLIPFCIAPSIAFINLCETTCRLPWNVLKCIVESCDAFMAAETSLSSNTLCIECIERLNHLIP